MSENRDYYEVLGVDRDADARTIKRAFLKKARTVHPDVSDDPEAEGKFKELNEAYSVLSDEQRRANYDRYGTADGLVVRATSISTIFLVAWAWTTCSRRSLAAVRRWRPQRRERRSGRDMAISLSVTLEEAALGCKKTISYDRLAPCETAMAPVGQRRTGKAVRPLPRYGLRHDGSAIVFGPGSVFLALPRLPWRGMVIDHPCETCDGQGRTPSHEKIDIDIPAGVSTGRQLRVSGFGEAGLRGEPSGDLIVNVRVADHERFKRNGETCTW